MIHPNILLIEKETDKKVLRKKPAPFDFSKFSKKEIEELVKNMRAIMKEAQGVGLAANQIGLNVSVFVAQVANKFYAIFNPELTAPSGETATDEEGCLSVPGSYGPVTRAEKLTLKGFNKNGKPIKIKAWGLLARVFQHETDHLNGKLFIDRAKEIYSVK